MARSKPSAKKAKSRNLDAFAIAQQEESTARIRIRPSRLGVIEEDARDGSVHAATAQQVEDHPAKRRRTRGLETFSDEDDADGDSDGMKWHLGVDGDDEDSDLDSDEAMGESDEEKFEGFAFRGSKVQFLKRPVHTNDPGDMASADGIDLLESSSESTGLEHQDNSMDEDDLGEDAVDLATALDMEEEYERKKKQTHRGSSESVPQVLRLTQATASDSSLSDSETSESEDEHSTLSVSDDEDSIQNHSRLKSFVHGLERLSPTNAPSRRSQPPVVMEEPSEYGLASSQKLTIADLLPAVKEPRLRESLKQLHSSERKGSKVATKGIPGKLEPPLAKRQQDRLDREAAYEKTKETLSRWVDTVKRNRRAEHISFPLSNPDSLAGLGTNQLMPTSQSEAFTPLESMIHSIMRESGLASNNDPLSEDNVQAFEELQEKKIPIEEVQIRRAELRKARDLMFREEVRARRIKKIKSKAYRRVHRKERDKNAREERAALVAADAVNSEEERMKKDRQRAEERMGARHKESRWAKGIKAVGRTSWDADARLGVNELARKDDELRRRIEGKDATQSDGSVIDSSDQESSDDVDVDQYDEVEMLKMKQKLGELEAADQANPSHSRLDSMPFMRKAELARRAVNKADIDETRRILIGEGGNSGEESKSMAETGGRRRYGLRQQTQSEREPGADDKGEFEEPMSADDAEPERPTEEQPSESIPDMLRQRVLNIKKVTTKHIDDRKKEKVVSSNTDNPWLSGPRKPTTELATDEAIISTQALLPDQKASRSNSKSRQLAPKRTVVSQPTMEHLTSLSDSEDETTPGSSAHEQLSSQRNEELVRMAFAGDDVFEAFADEKKVTVDEEGDQIVDATLPGWGSWIGAGISKKEKRRTGHHKTKIGIKGVDPNKRKDAKLDRVIINEKRLKKNTKYLASELPHPFESREQYERSLRLPLGPEWTTKTTFQDAIKPRILLKQGIIRPMEKPIA